MTDERIHLAVKKETYDELAELKESGVTWDYLLTRLAREYNGKPRLDL
ncbi:hypothetical protein [Natronococcus pandeyae]|nr:hypothetical protein [Natronococcus pandeyae]